MAITYIRNVFQTESIDSWWSNQDKIVVSTLADGVKVLSPITLWGNVPLVESANISGNFVLEYGAKLSNPIPTINDLTMSIYGVNDLMTPMAGIWWSKFLGGVIFYSDGSQTQVINSFFNYVALKEIKFKITRTSGVIRFYYYNSGWIELVLAASNNNNIANIDIQAEENSSGYTYFNFRAESGFPYITPVINKIDDINGLLVFASEYALNNGLFAHRLDRDIKHNSELIELVDDTSSLNL